MKAGKEKIPIPGISHPFPVFRLISTDTPFDHVWRKPGLIRKNACLISMLHGIDSGSFHVIK